MVKSWEGESLEAGKRPPMFTGLIEEVGRLESVSPTQGGGAKIRVKAARVLEDVQMGDSIAVNGTCLTAIEWGSDWVVFDAVAETLRLTTLASLKSGTPVNLERALAVGSRVGGHYVTGHVDGQGKLVSTTRSGNGIIYRFSAEPELMVMIARKGSIAVDGISLTVVDVTSDQFTVWIVPHTVEATNLGHIKAGDAVNLETDILAKYVHRAMSSEKHGGLQLQRLQEAGFIQ